VLCHLSDGGVDEAIFVVGRKRDPLETFVGDGSRWGMSAAFVEQPEPCGLADAVGRTRDLVGDERFLTYLGDNLLGDGIAEFARAFAECDAAASLIVKEVDDPRAFGVVVVEDGVVTRLVEKPDDPPSDLAIVGTYGFGPQIWEAIDRIEPSGRGELEITDAIDHLVQSGARVECHITEGYWVDAGSPETLLAANRFFLDAVHRRVEGDVDGDSVLEGAVQIGAGARIVNSRIEGPCLIGPDTVIEDCRIGPHVCVGEECDLRRVSIADSVIDDGTSIHDVRAGVDGSLVGRDVEIAGIDSDSPLKLVLADNTIAVASPGG
jgi:glucose-1-phosphate thymidylyltransferase